jgi:glycosyltransferase involved in cell wall biosynthesis
LTRCSFLLITRNRGENLPGVFTQIQEQKKGHDEVVVVGYLPDDDTYGGVSENQYLVDKLLHVRAENSSEAINAAVPILDGKYTRIISDDDYTYPDAMEGAIGVMESNSDIDLLVCGGVKLDTVTGQVAFVYIPKGESYAEKPEDVLQWGAAGSGFLLRTDILKKIIFNGVVADLTFAVDCINAGLKVKFCRTKLFRHKIDARGTLYNKALEVNRVMRALYIKYNFIYHPRKSLRPSWDGSLT